MVTAPTDGKVSSGSLPLCKRCFTRHIGACTIKCHKCGKVRHKARYCKEKNVATGANVLPILTCYDCGEQGHTKNRCPRKVKQEEVGEVRGRAYAIKDADPQGPNVVTGTFLLNNRYASVLFDSGSDRSFVDTRFSSMLNIDPVRIGASYEVELADGRVVSTNTVLKGCTLNLVNHIFKIDLMPIEFGTFDVIISLDWLVKHDAVIVYGEKVVRIPYQNKTLIVESDKGVSRLKVISCIKAHKYVERGSHLFLAHVMEKKSKEKRLEDVPVICEFLEMFLEDLPGLPLSRQGKKEKEAFQMLKQKLCSAPILALPEGTDDFVVHEENYTTHDLELGAVVFAFRHFTSRLWRSLQEELGNNLDMSTAYHPQTDGQSERTIQMLEDMLPYTLELPEELKGIHSTFHVSNLKKCPAEGNVVILMDEIQLDDKLHMIEEPVEVVDRVVKRLKQSRIPIVKVRWNS
ncbi:reverse transcriptase domain-containing protein [Tanacetum coccineum]